MEGGTLSLGDSQSDGNAIPRPECGEMHTLISWSPSLFHIGEIGDRGIVICLLSVGCVGRHSMDGGIGLVYGRGVSLVLQYQPQQFQLVGVAKFEVKTGRMIDDVILLRPL